MYSKDCEVLACKYNIKNKCYNKCKTPPFISCGTSELKKDVVKKKERNGKGLSNRSKKAYEYSLKSKSLSWIAKKLKCSKTTAHRDIRNVEAFLNDNKGVTKRNDKGILKIRNASTGMFKRLHNDVISFLIEPISFWGDPNIVKLKYTSYLKIKRKGLYIQLFPNTLTVRFLEDIECKTVSECRKLAEERILHFLKTFSYDGVNFLDGKYKQVSRHYAILGTSIAKKFVKEKIKFYVFDKDDGKSRLAIDFSHRRPEFEAEHPIKGLNDSKLSEAFFDDLLNKPSDLPSESKAKLDFIVSVQKEYAEQIRKHLLVQDETLKTLKAIQNSLNK